MVPGSTTCLSPAPPSFLWGALRHPSARSRDSDVTRRSSWFCEWAGRPYDWDSVFVLESHGHSSSSALRFQSGEPLPDGAFLSRCPGDAGADRDRTGLARDPRCTAGPHLGREDAMGARPPQPPGPRLRVATPAFSAFASPPLSGWEAFEKGLTYQLCCLRTFTYSPS